MKAGYLAFAAAVALGVSAGNHHAHNHEAFHLAARDAAPALAANTTCGCGSYTVWVTTYGEATLYLPPPPSTSTPAAPATTTVEVVVVPTPAVTTFSTPGTYTIPATTVTLTSTTTVCAATSTNAPPGSYTLGGVTTIVATSTTVVCPLATTTVNNGVVTSHIITTTYVCPSAGTYTIGPITTTVVDQTVIVYPTPASYPPGTYTQPEVVTTITETDYVVFCPFTAVAPPAATTTPVVAVATSAPAATSSASSGPGLGSGGNKWAITYTPYTTGGDCKSASDVLVDITTIKSKGFSVVRIYATDCGGLNTVGAACEAVGLKMIIGVFINGQGIGAAQQQVTDIIAWNKWSLVELIVIGNEAIASGSATPEALVAFISSSKSAFQGAGYTGPCTTTEPLNTLQQHASLICAVVDVTGANLHPFFNADVTAANAGSFVAQELAIVDALCEGKSGINLETGWPSGGNCNGAACPSPGNQQLAIEGILSSVGGRSVFFSFVNDPWKAPGQFDCERFWGAIHVFE